MWLSPAYNLGYQQIRVSADQHDSTLRNSVSGHARFGLTLAQAQAELAQVQALVKGWRRYFQGVGVPDQDLDVLEGFMGQVRSSR